MRFTEINLFGVYVAPISLIMIGAWLVTIALRRVANRFGSVGGCGTSIWAHHGRAMPPCAPM